MEMKKKNLFTTGLAVALAALLLIGGGTFAYLQSNTGDTVNTFNTNKVMVELKETTGENYNIIPGTTQDKDPKVTVNNTVDAYVYVKVTDTTQGLVTYEMADGWELLDGYTDVYYREVSANDDEKEFSVLEGDKVSYSASLENSDMLDDGGNLKTGIELTFKAYAIQKQPFVDAEAAYNRKDATVISTEDALKSAFKISSKINVTEDIALTQAQVITQKDTTLYLDGILSYDGTTKNAAPFWIYGSIGKPRMVTVDGTGGVQATKEYCFTVGRRKNQIGSLIINGGTFTAPVTAIFCQYGTVIINDGFFACDPATADYGSDFLLNCLDTSYKEGTASITVKGGTFVNFNPANNQAEGPNTNFVAEGYKAIKETKDNGDIWYTVVKES